MALQGAFRTGAGEDRGEASGEAWVYGRRRGARDGGGVRLLDLLPDQYFYGARTSWRLADVTVLELVGARKFSAS